MTELYGIKAFAPYFEDGGEREREKLEGEIHPCFARERWDEKDLRKHRAWFPVEGYEGEFWEISNARVWEAMRPALQLATRLLTTGLFWIGTVLVPSLHHWSSDTDHIDAR